jgi:hypothetical protein
MLEDYVDLIDIHTYVKFNNLKLRFAIDENLNVYEIRWRKKIICYTCCGRIKFADGMFMCDTCNVVTTEFHKEAFHERSDCWMVDMFLASDLREILGLTR